MTGADLLAEELRAREVPYIATLNGHGLDPFYLACKRTGMHMIDVRNEQSASYIAEVTGRLSRSVGVCAVSGAVAHVKVPVVGLADRQAVGHGGQTGFIG